MTKTYALSNLHYAGLIISMARFLLLILLITLVSSCKIQILGKTGGIVEVQRDNIRCKANELCEFDVRDQFFDKTFSARAHSNYIFLGWKGGHKRFCSASKQMHVPCRLTTKHFNDNPDLLRILYSDEVFYLDPQFVPIGPLNTRRLGNIPLELLGETQGFGQYGLPVTVVFDRDGDGDEDVFRIFNYLREQFGARIKEPGRSVIHYYENNNGVLEDKTVKYFGERERADLARNIQVFDLNHDGSLDIILASNNEDGRELSSDPADAGAPLTVFLSGPDGTYEELKIGHRIWAHAVSVGDIDHDGIPEIIVAGFHAEQVLDRHPLYSNAVYEMFPDGTWREDPDYGFGNEKLHDGGLYSPHAHRLGDLNGDGCLDLVSVGQWPDVNEIVYYTGDCTGNLEETSRHSPRGEFFEMPGRAWNGDETIWQVTDIGGEWVAGLIIYWIETLDIDLDGDQDVLYILSGFRISDSDRERNYVDAYADASLGGTYNHIYLLENRDGSLVRRDGVIEDLVQAKNLFFSRVIDINGDNLPDLVFSEWNISTEDGVYLNQGDGTFERATFSDLNSASISFIVPIDYNLDDKMDFLGSTLGEAGPVDVILERQ